MWDAGEVWNSNVRRYLTEVTIQMAATTSRIIVDQGSLIPLLKICKRILTQQTFLET